MRYNGNEKLRWKIIEKENPQTFTFPDRFGTHPYDQEKEDDSNLKDYDGGAYFECFVFHLFKRAGREI